MHIIVLLVHSAFLGFGFGFDDGFSFFCLSIDLDGNINNRRCRDLSLQDFLDKKTTTKETVCMQKEKKKFPFDSVCRSVLMNGEGEITQRSDTRLNPPDAPPSSTLASSCSAERVCDSLRVQRASTKQRLVDELNRSMMFLCPLYVNDGDGDVF